MIEHVFLHPLATAPDAPADNFYILLESTVLLSPQRINRFFREALNVFPPPQSPFWRRCPLSWGIGRKAPNVSTFSSAGRVAPRYKGIQRIRFLSVPAASLEQDGNAQEISIGHTTLFPPSGRLVIDIAVFPPVRKLLTYKLPF